MKVGHIVHMLQDPSSQKPEVMLDIVFSACQMAIRVEFSCLLYQDDVTVARFSMLGLMRVKGAILRMIRGKKGAAQSPMTNRQTQKPAPPGMS